MTSPSPLHGLRMLIVEDETMVAMMVEELLESFGCEVVAVAASVKQALAVMAADTGAIDGAILDVNIAGEKVFPVADALTAKSIPFVFATGYGASGLDPGFEQHPVIAKPFRVATLSQVLIKTLT